MCVICLLVLFPNLPSAHNRNLQIAKSLVLSFSFRPLHIISALLPANILEKLPLYFVILNNCWKIVISYDTLNKGSKSFVSRKIELSILFMGETSFQIKLLVLQDKKYWKCFYNMKRLQSFILNFTILLLPSVVSHKKPRGTIWHIPYIVRAVIVQILQGVRKCSFGLRKPIILWLWAMCIEHVFLKSFILDCSFPFVSNRNIINYRQNNLE